MSETDSDRYFQEIARHFLERRGAPFFLSAKDLDLISAWERNGIPLPIVLEGIGRAFAARRGGAAMRGKVLSLSFCRAEVEGAFERDRDRKVGGTRRPPGRSDKWTRIRAEVEGFMKRFPSGLGPLKPIFLEVREELAKSAVSDEALERLEADLERSLLAQTGADERAAAQREILAEHKSLRGAALAAAVDLKLVKRVRDRHRIPYLSPFYY
jgi:hypothetical protein